jgi:MOSC domain-containing protein YiiM
MSQAVVEAVCISPKKGIVKREVGEAVLREDWGIEDDAHAGKWHRQVSLLAGESIDGVRETLPTLRNGAFAENIITRGLDLTAIQVGDRLRVGDTVILEITQIGKKCHNDGCAIKKATGDCIMPKEGLFARVVCGGNVRNGDRIQQRIVIVSGNG